MATPSKYVTREEFEPVKNGLERLNIRVEVISQDLYKLTLEVAELAESVNARFDAVDARFDGIDGRLDGIDGRLDGIDGRLDRLEKTMIEGNAALMSAILKLSPR